MTPKIKLPDRRSLPKASAICGKEVMKMSRKQITQLFPWLVPLRKWQRKLFFYLGMRLDRNRYSSAISETLLPVEVFSSGCPMYNRDTGFDMIYQENKVHNLKLAAAAFDGMLIRPGETFSFSLATRHADRREPYRDGLTVIGGCLTTAPGGGMCQLSNLLFWVFLHSPLTVTERHGHSSKDFPEPPSDAPMGVDATLAEGWKDLKVRNDTDCTFQVHIAFDRENIYGHLYADRQDPLLYCVRNGPVSYRRRQGAVWEEVDVIQTLTERESGQVQKERILYRNVCRIGYPLPEGTPIEDTPVEDTSIEDTSIKDVPVK